MGQASKAEFSPAGLKTTLLNALSSQNYQCQILLYHLWADGTVHPSSCKHVPSQKLWWNTYNFLETICFSDRLNWSVGRVTDGMWFTLHFASNGFLFVEEISLHIACYMFGKYHCSISYHFLDSGLPTRVDVLCTAGRYKFYLFLSTFQDKIPEDTTQIGSSI